MLPPVIAKLQSLTMELLLRFLDETLRTMTAPLSTSLELLTGEEAARMMKVPKSHVYELVRTGRLPHVRVGKYVRIPVAALRDWLAASAEDVDSLAHAGHTRAPRRRQAPTGRRAAS
jgi:excisionase family DNA binding protein